jgi:hypothetical protein
MSPPLADTPTKGWIPLLYGNSSCQHTDFGVSILLTRAGNPINTTCQLISVMSFWIYRILGSCRRGLKTSTFWGMISVSPLKINLQHLTASRFAPSLTLKKESTIDFQRATWYYVPEDRALHFFHSLNSWDTDKGIQYYAHVTIMDMSIPPLSHRVKQTYSHTLCTNG